MRTLIILFTILLVAALVTPSPVERHQASRGSAVKGGRPGVKGYHPTPFPQLRKGEYMCGDKICKLKPGEEPKGCNGICQYPI